MRILAGSKRVAGADDAVAAVQIGQDPRLGQARGAHQRGHGGALRGTDGLWDNYS